ncbi:hypothetical protein ACTHQ4_02955 [Alkalicoccobacillus gibsonii]|jgi:hypothetical protein|uniref:hypothetical protein n=1 Tax=Alkalicoccobacillus gibsonii TaxID=79881 RepID=UPI003517C4DF
MKFPIHINTEEVASKLQPSIASTYKKLAASRYFTASHLELLSSEAKHILQTHHSESGIWGHLLYIEGVFQRSIQFNTTDQSHRRFDHFYTSLEEDINKALVEHKDSQAVRSFMRQLVVRLEQDQQYEHAPWPSIIEQCIPLLSAGHLEHLDQNLMSSSLHNGSSASVRLKSYVTLLVGKEKQALDQLLSFKTNWSEQQLTIHFKCLESRERWDTILQWLKQLFPTKTKNKYGSLQAYADRSHSHLNQHGVFLTDVWDRWLLAPSFQRFAALTAHEKKDKKQQIVDYLLPRLEAQLHQAQAVQVYIRLLHDQQRFDKAAEYFLMHERNPSRLHEDKEALLEAMKTFTPELLKPVFHQFVVRLAEKKSRIHYEKAAFYVSELLQVYQLDQSEALFYEYLERLKAEYKTYRAFIKELNVIHA